MISDGYFAGVTMMIVHNQNIHDILKAVPIPILVGQLNTGKTFLAKVAAAMAGGTHRNGIYHHVTMAKMADLLLAI